MLENWLGNQWYRANEKGFRLLSFYGCIKSRLFATTLGGLV